MPGEERKMPPQLNILGYRNAVRHIISQAVSEHNSEYLEDVIDEGDDVLNRRMPKHENVNGSIPNQHSIGFSMDMDERQNIAIVRSIIGQQRLRQRNQISAAAEDIEEEDGGYSANLHDEHLQEARGI